MKAAGPRGDHCTVIDRPTPQETRPAHGGCRIADAGRKSQEIGVPKQGVLSLQPLLSTCAPAPFRSPRGPNTMQVMQGSDLGWLLVIVAVAGFLAGRAQLGRQAWRRRRWGEPQTWRDGRWKGRWETPQTWRKRPWGRGEAEFPKTGAVPVTDPAEQLRLVMGARFDNLVGGLS